MSNSKKKSPTYKITIILIIIGIIIGSIYYFPCSCHNNKDLNGQEEPPAPDSRY